MEPRRDKGPEDEAPLSAAQQRLVGRMRRLSLISAAIMAAGVAALLGVIGYRLLAPATSPRAAADMVVPLPRGATVVSATVAQDLVVVVIDLDGAREVRTFSLPTLRPAGHLRFVVEP